MHKFSDSPFEGTLEVISTLSSDVIEASVREQHEQDRLTVGLRDALRYGVPIDELSAASGISVDKIRARVDRELNMGEDLASLTGSPATV